MEETLHSPREQNPKFGPEENFENPREENIEKPSEVVAKEVVIKKKRKQKSSYGSYTPPMRRSKRLFDKYVEASITIVNIDSFEYVENEPLNNFSYEELRNQPTTSDTIIREQSPQIEVSLGLAT